MNKKILYSIISIAALVILIVIFTKMSNTKAAIFITKQLDARSREYMKINDKVSKLIKGNGVYLLNTEKDKISYLILDGSYMNLKNEAPYFLDVKIENKEASIMIYFGQQMKTYPDGKYPEQRLIYKITKDKNYEYIRVFKNGEETHIDSVIIGRLNWSVT